MRKSLRFFLVATTLAAIACSEQVIGPIDPSPDPLPEQPDNTVATVDLDHETLALAEGDAQQLTATPRNAAGAPLAGLGLEWTTSNSAIATVDAAGKVTALRVGTAVIQVKVNGKTAAAPVTVTADYPYDLIYRRWANFQLPEMYRLDIGDPAAEPLRFLPDVAGVWEIALAPDGRHVAYVVVHSAEHSTIYVAGAEGTIPLATESGLNDQPAWSPDGQYIAYRHFDFGAEEDADIWVMDAADGAHKKNLTGSQGESSEHQPAWSPVTEGEARIAYSRNQGDGTIALWTMLPDGSDQRQITADYADVSPAWSPDGQTLVFERYGEDAPLGLYLMNPDGTSPRPLVNRSRGVFSPAFSPDGKLVAFTGRDGAGIYQIYTVWADGTKVAQRTFGDVAHERAVWASRIQP